MKSKFAKSHGLSNSQEDILCNIQRATIDKNKELLNMLPSEVLEMAEKAQVEFNKKGVTELAISLDNSLCELVKKYWNKRGMAISQ